MLKRGVKFGHLVSKETREKIGNANRKPVYYKCDYCQKKCITTPSVYKKKKRHFCNLKCYSNFRKEKMSMEEQPNYKGIRKAGQSKQVYHRNYCKRHPKRIAHLKARRYAKEKGAEGSHTIEEWNNLLAEFDYKCAFCRKKVKLTKDHIIPLSEDGTDYIENIQPLCKSCNSKKWKFLV